MAALRAPLYKELLTPVLHRRFTGAAAFILIVCYVEAILIGDKTSCMWIPLMSFEITWLTS